MRVVTGSAASGHSSCCLIHNVFLNNSLFMLNLRNVENGQWQSYPSGFVCKGRAKCGNVTDSGVTSYGNNLFMYACIYVSMYFISSSTVEPIWMKRSTNVVTLIVIINIYMYIYLKKKFIRNTNSSDFPMYCVHLHDMQCNVTLSVCICSLPVPNVKVTKICIHDRILRLFEKTQCTPG